MIQGFAVHAAGAELHPYKYDPGTLQPGDVEIAVTHCGVSPADVNLIDNEQGASKFPFIPGHEVVGTIAQLGEGVSHLQVGQRVGVGWYASSCGHCAWCRHGEENLCARAQPICAGRHGGFAEALRVDARFAVPIPESMESAATAPLLSTGTAVYEALRTQGVNPSSRVGVLGMGGVGHLALQFARAFGAEVTAFSSTASKEEDARQLGAQHFIGTRESKSLKALAGCFDVILCTISADAEWPAYLAALRPRGSLVFVGAPPKPLQLPALALLAGAKAVRGASTGGPVQIAEMLEVAARHKVQARVELFAMREANAAVERVRKGSLRYRAVLTQ